MRRYQIYYTLLDIIPVFQDIVTILKCLDIISATISTIIREPYMYILPNVLHKVKYYGLKKLQRVHSKVDKSAFICWP